MDKNNSFRDVSDDVVREIKEIRGYSSAKTTNDSGFSESNGQLAHTDSNNNQIGDKRFLNKKKRNLTEIENI